MPEAVDVANTVSSVQRSSGQPSLDKTSRPTSDSHTVPHPVSATVEFRRATNADCEIAQRIVGGALGEYGLDLLLETSDKDLLDLEAHYDACGGEFEIISLRDIANGDRDVGVLGWKPGAPGTLELKKVYLDRAARGRNLGRVAVERVIARARADGYSAIVLETAYAMTAAIALYERLGFRRVSGDDAGSFATLSDDCEQAFRLDLTPAT
jgi:putative acetyltransferase